MTGNLLKAVEQIIPRVDPELAAFLSMRVAMAEAALGDPIRAVDRLEAMPRSFFAMGISAVATSCSNGARPRHP